MHSSTRHTCRRWCALWLKLRWCDSFSLHGGALWHLRRQTYRRYLVGFCDTSCRRQLVAETAQDLHGSKAARLWWTQGRLTEHYSCPHASLHGPENIAGREGCRRPREDRMPRSRRVGLSSQGERGRCSLICTHCERMAPWDTFSRRHYRGRARG